MNIGESSIWVNIHLDLLGFTLLQVKACFTWSKLGSMETFSLSGYHYLSYFSKVLLVSMYNLDYRFKSKGRKTSTVTEVKENDA